MYLRPNAKAKLVLSYWLMLKYQADHYLHCTNTFGYTVREGGDMALSVVTTLTKDNCKLWPAENAGQTSPLS